MKTLLYIHGYNSNGNARKCQQLRSMFPEHTVVAPTLDYNGKSPNEILDSLKRLVEDKSVDMIVGSSFGGYYTLCCTKFFDGPVWVINPVRDMMKTLDLLKPGILEGTTWEEGGSQSAARHPLRLPFKAFKMLVRAKRYNAMTALYRTFDSQVFQTLCPKKGSLNFALSLDDDLLGDHHELLQRFPNHNQVVWKDHSGHHFARFEELKPQIAETLDPSLSPIGR